MTLVPTGSEAPKFLFQYILIPMQPPNSFELLTFSHNFGFTLQVLYVHNCTSKSHYVVPAWQLPLNRPREVQRVRNWLPGPERQLQPVSVPYSATLQTIFILFCIFPYLVAVFICSQDFRHFSTLFVQISVSCFYNLVFAIYRAEAFQLETPESGGTIIDSCLVSPRFTKTGETLEGLVFPITSLITDQSAPLKCALSGCLRWCTSHVYAH